MISRESSNGHISLPKPFASGDVVEWFNKYDICCKENKWSDETNTIKLPTLLEGEALAVLMELSEEQQSNYKQAKEKITDKLAPSKFEALDNFHNRRLRPGEALSVFVHDMKMLLEQAMPRLNNTACDQLLLH